MEPISGLVFNMTAITAFYKVKYSKEDEPINLQKSQHESTEKSESIEGEPVSTDMSI